jgi:hypothetical protein
MLCRVVWQTFTDVSEVLVAAIIRAITSETSVNFYQTTRRNIPEVSNLHTRHRENLKSHQEKEDRLFYDRNWNRRLDSLV